MLGACKKLRSTDKSEPVSPHIAPDGKNDSSCIPDMSGKNRKSKRKMSEQKKSYSLEEFVAEGHQNEHNALLTRSKTYDASVSKEVEKETASVQRKASVSNLAKHAVNFHRVFKDLSEEGSLQGTFSCAWQREMPYYGRLYIANTHICFYCSVLRREVKVIIPVANISVLKKANTALLVPNAICIRTSEGEKFLFGSIRSRESAYQLLRSVCKYLKDSSQSNSPNVPSISSEHLLKVPLNSKELDANYNSPEKTDVADRIQISYEVSCEQQQQETKQQKTGQTMKSERNQRTERCRLNTIILIYLLLAVLLLCSSGYIGLRIIQLEEQLTSMGAWPELDLQHQYKAS
ncbi:GRAM domain-containing protein 2B-like isoform X1 [Crotalus tigris]|uniref:GRAM domain-containing protein 2B-like isoform X1 n=2 Tax=Crotalus tigris TaxID=88082 RepID=UPI00192F71B7|nr:GRAM domain-containing protein 2B-like isoform X1 [Crotalus tigris]XP_039190695.1 GRAM domain-containing protein 2B-like isoform X1 [Crotalus tigris]